jgi:hypothetical protein
MKKFSWCFMAQLVAGVALTVASQPAFGHPTGGPPPPTPPRITIPAPGVPVKMLTNPYTGSVIVGNENPYFTDEDRQMYGTQENKDACEKETYNMDHTETATQTTTVTTPPPTRGGGRTPTMPEGTVGGSRERGSEDE